MLDNSLKTFHQPLTTLIFILFLSPCVLSTYGHAKVQPDDKPVSFTAEQAAAGKKSYATYCAACHGEVLEGNGPAPALANEFFDERWGDKPASELATHIRRMPPGVTGLLDEATYTNLQAFIFQANGHKPGDAPMPSTMEALARVYLPKKLTDTFSLHTANASDAQRAILSRLPLAQAKQPADEDWLHWGNSYDGHSYSGLDQINTGNVANLELAWKLPLLSGPNHAAPLVHQGVMYMYVYPDSLLAVDATSGSILWRYRHEVGGNSYGKLGIAMDGDRIYMPTSDMKLLAIHAKTGELIWEQAIIERVGGIHQLGENHYLRSAPMVVGDTVVQPVAGPLMKYGNFIVGMNSKTGKRLWQFNTLHGTAEADKTWSDVPAAERSGGSVWHYATYDIELDLMYFGVSQTYDPLPLLKPDGSPKPGSNALYTNSTIALKPRTGELAWHFQHIPAGQWDQDWAFERQVVDLNFQGRERRAVITVGKLGVLDAMDAATGQYLFSVDLGSQDYITAIDPKTGDKTIDPEKYARKDMKLVGCPHISGVRTWTNIAYNPKLRRLYVPSYETCAEMTITGLGTLTTGMNFKQVESPYAPKGKLAKWIVVDLDKQAVVRADYKDAPVVTGVLTTKGDLVFAGDTEPAFKALDADTGELLWKMPLDQTSSASVISYAVDGVQYVALSVGMINNLTKLKADFYNEIHQKNTQTGVEGAALWVFALKPQHRQIDEPVVAGFFDSLLASIKDLW